MSDEIRWVEQDGELTAVLPDGRSVAWAAQPGFQQLFLSCPIFEVLLEGGRGGGKTDALLMSFAQHVGRGWRQEWRGILFRQTYKQLSDVVEKTRKWYPRIFPDAKFNESDMVWTWKDGEKLWLRYMERKADYQNYHGHAYPWIGWEELTNWHDDSCYRVMFSCCRSPVKDIPRLIRGTANPSGAGHNWVKMRFQLPVLPGRGAGPVIEEDGAKRVAITSSLRENLVLLHADPEYRARIKQAATNPAVQRAWLEGDWNIVAGGMFDDLWKPSVHVLPDFSPPEGWRVDRAFDWGSSKPFSVGWWAESDGSDLVLPTGIVKPTLRGDLFRIREWYGCRPDTPNEGLRMLATDITKGIIIRENLWGLRSRTVPGVADSAIFAVENGMSIAGDMAQPVMVGGKRVRGIQWLPADKRKGSRKTGWELLRGRLQAATEGPVRERPGLFVCEGCRDFLRTMPVLPRDLDNDPDDVATDSEDHIADETRYRVRFSTTRARSGKLSGVPS